MSRAHKPRGLTRRAAIRTEGAAGIVASVGPFMHVRPARAARTLRILQWSHFVPGYDKWFNGTYTKEWGRRNDTEVIVDNVDLSQIDSFAAAEVATQWGHDLVLFLSPPALYEEQVVDMGDVYAECERRHGKPIDLAVKSTYNPKTRRYFAFSDSFVPDPVNYRTDLWREVDMRPDTWEDIRVGGKKIKDKTGIPVGIGLSAEIETGMAVLSILYSFGGQLQDAEGNPKIDSPQTLEALKFVKELFEEAEKPEVLTWHPSSNNRQMLLGRSSLVLNAISITRAGEDNKMAIQEKIGLAKPAMGPVRRISVPNVKNNYVVWKFSENIAGAKRFLVDYLDNFRQAFLASEFHSLPFFEETVPDLKQLVSNDPRAVPPNKYALLADAFEWTTNVGDPGYSTAPIAETFERSIINKMFAECATGAEAPEDALAKANLQMKAIWAKWKYRGLI